MLPEVAQTYSTEFREQEGTVFLPLWIPTTTPTSAEIYHHPMSGIHIDSVEADGVKIDGRIHDIDYDDFDLGSLRPKYPWHGYQLVMYPTNDSKSFELIFVSRMEEKDFALSLYLIPRDTKRLVIQYRPRYPMDELGNSLTAVAERNELSP